MFGIVLHCHNNCRFVHTLQSYMYLYTTFQPVGYYVIWVANVSFENRIKKYMKLRLIPRLLKNILICWHTFLCSST